jgi:hypothetical protein
MQSLLLIANDKRLSDTFVSVDALIECKSADTVASVYEDLEYVLNQFGYYHMTIWFEKFCSGNWEGIFNKQFGLIPYMGLVVIRG